MKNFKILHFLIIIPLQTTVAFALDIQAKVIHITDGDTITVLNDNHRQIKIRLNAIDCPEMGQAYGQAAKKAAASLAFDQDVTIYTHGLDKYGRTIGDVHLTDGMMLNHELVKEGWCWWYRKYAPGNRELEELEREAREAKIGLWTDPNPIPPWSYRKLTG